MTLRACVNLKGHSTTYSAWVGLLYRYVSPLAGEGQKSNLKNVIPKGD